jgi:hypothetical protein
MEDNCGFEAADPFWTQYSLQKASDDASEAAALAAMQMIQLRQAVALESIATSLANANRIFQKYFGATY